MGSSWTEVQCLTFSNSATLTLKRQGGDAMRYLRVMMLVSICGLSTPVFAEICCPSGCSADSNPPRCIFNGTANTCGQVACAPTPQRTRGPTGPAPPGEFVPPSGSPCIGLGATGAELVKKCVSELSGNAQFFGCFLFEDSAGRAEDARTGLSCPARQAALAKQCRARCSDFAAKFPTCRDPKIVWQESFGDIGGLAFGSARVELCGPRLASGYRPFPSYREHGWK